MADTTLPGLLATGDHASRPAASAVGTGALYSCTDHALVYQTDGSSWTTWASLGGGGIPETLIDAAGDLIVGSAADTAARLAIGANATVLTSNGTTATWAAPAGGAASPLASQSAFRLASGTSLIIRAPGPLTVGNVLICAVGSNQHVVSSIAQTNVTWTKIDEALLASGAYAMASLWKGVIASGAKNKITVTMAGSNTAGGVVAEFAGWAGTVASNGTATQASGADLSMGAITSSSGNLIVAATYDTAGTTDPGTTFDGGLVGLIPGVQTNQMEVRVGLSWRVSDGSSITPKMEDNGNNKAAAWGVISA